jgi:uncharacterized protein (DUF2235 family)
VETVKASRTADDIDGHVRNLVICCDGTSNEIGKQISNVLKLYRIADKSDRQIVFYQPGIGTIRMPDAWGRWRQKARSLFEMATGRGLDRDVLNAYLFLAKHYRKGDRIFLFGFSRGAYTVGVLAGMLYLVGLLRDHQSNFASYALKAYKEAAARNDYSTVVEFCKTVLPQSVPVHFLGVWDTVASVVVPGGTIFARLKLEELPNTCENSAVETFRHAMAIDERRRMFRLKPWIDGQEFKPNRFSKKAKFPAQDSRQVWFAGSHADVGGGFAEEESALAKYPLLWMLEQAADKGLKIRRAMVNHLVLGRERAGARSYTKPAPEGTLHNSMTWGWAALEIFPKTVKLREWRKRWAIFGYYLPFAEYRYIPSGSLIHTSVVQRLKVVPDYKPRNLPTKHVVETMKGPIAAETSGHRKKA